MNSENTQTPEYSIIIPAYNEESELPQTLESIRAAQQQCTDRAGEVIVVDNASTDRTAAIANESGATVVTESERQIARVRNTGAKSARGKYLVFLDADTVMAPPLLAQALSALDSGIVCGGGCAVFYKYNPGGFARPLVWIWAFFSRWKRWAAGSFLFCLRAAFEEIGGFDESLYYSEEVTLSKALGRWGRSHGMEFVILDTPVYTSPRKFGWFSSWKIFVALLLAPLRKRNKEKSRLWYDRPKEK